MGNLVRPLKQIQRDAAVFRFTSFVSGALAQIEGLLPTPPGAGRRGSAGAHGGTGVIRPCEVGGPIFV